MPDARRASHEGTDDRHPEGRLNGRREIVTIRRMGAWGDGPFDNDDAGDWGYEFDGADEETGLQILAQALDVGGPGEFLEGPDGSIAVAAAEVVSWMLDRGAIPNSPYGEDPAAWVRATERRPDDRLTEAALGALDRVRSADSELAELWAETEEEAAWRESLARIEARVRSGA